MNSFKKYSIAIFSIFWVALPGAAYSGSFESLSPSSAAQTRHFLAGRLAIVKGDWEGARKEFHRALKQNPGNADLENLLGFSYQKSDRLALALTHYKKAIDINPAHLGANIHMGWTYLSMGQVDEAERYLRAVEKICGQECEEYELFRKGIASYKGRFQTMQISSEAM